jgi:pyruvate dehydrogenase E1 component alpha subunit
LNFAALHDLPVIFICENNGLAVHTKIEARQSYDLGEHAAGYGLAVTRTPEGWDFGCIDESFSAIVDEVRQSRRPQFVEIATYRYKEHVGPGEDFDAGYRSRDDFEAWLARDPLHQDQALVERFRPLITAEIDDAVAFAEAAPFPTAEDLLSEVVPPPAAAVPNREGTGIATYREALQGFMHDALAERAKVRS